jgi:stress response protein YsnF
MAHTVIGIFENWTNAHNAGRSLLNNGFSTDNIDISHEENTHGRVKHDENKVSEFFNNLFGSDNDDSRNYSNAARNNTVLTVHCDSRDEAERAARLMDESGALDINGEGLHGESRSTYGTPGDVNSRSESIPIIEENLEVGKRDMQTGRVRLRSKIIEKPIERHLRLRSENVTIERNPVNRVASEEELRNFKEGTIEATEHKEVPIVKKEAKVVEEVRLNKNVEEHEETIKDNVRKTEVEEEHLHEEDDNYRRK